MLDSMQTSPLADQVFVITSLSTFLAGAEPDMDLLLQQSNSNNQRISSEPSLASIYCRSEIQDSKDI